VAAIIDVEALATAEEALIEDLVEVNSGIELDINKLYNSIFNDIVP